MYCAAYRGDTLLVVDTVEKVAKFLGLTVERVKWQSTPAVRERYENSEEGLYITRVEEEEEEK